MSVTVVAMWDHQRVRQSFPGGFTTSLIAATIMGVASVLVVAWATPKGLGITPDSIVYISVVDSLVNFGKMETHNGQTLTYYPPLLPILIASGVQLGATAVTVAQLLNLAAVFALPFVTLALSRQCGVGIRVSVFLTALILLLPATLWVSTFLWTESLFIVACLSTLVLAGEYLRRQRPIWLLGAMGVLWIAVGLRFIGVALIPVIIFSVVLSGRGKSFTRIAGSIIALAGLALAPLIAYCLWIVGQGQVPFGARGPSQRSFLEIALTSLEAIGSLLLPQDLGLITAVGGLVIALLSSVLGVWAVLGRKQSAVLQATFVLTYLLILFYTQASSQIDPVGWRFLAPIVPSVVLLTAVGMYALKDRQSPGRNPLRVNAVRILVTVIISIIAVGAPVRLANYFSIARTEGLVYNANKWHRACVQEALSSISPFERKSSDDEVALYWLTRDKVVSLDNLSTYGSYEALLQRRTDAVVLFYQPQLKESDYASSLDSRINSRTFCRGEIRVLHRI